MGTTPLFQIKDALREMIVLEQRGAGEAQESRVWQRQPHVAGELTRLRAVCLVGDDDDVVPLAIGFRHLLVELVNQGEDVGVILAE